MTNAPVPQRSGGEFRLTKEMKMLKTGKLITAIAIATLALPAIAGSWPNLPARKALSNTTQPAPTKSAVANFTQSQDGYAREGEGEARLTTSQAKADAATVKVTGFEYTGGEAGWQPAQHKFVWKAGRFAHSDECDHAIRPAKAATPAELESARLSYSGG